MEFLILLYNCVAAGVLIIILGNFLLNSYFFKDTSGYSLSGLIKTNAPLVSILIPARNEEKNIRRCLRSLSRQSYPNFEIIVLDDNSCDGTSQAVKDFAENRRKIKIKLYSVVSLPPDWLGKSFACHQLAGFAKGEFLLFTDADTLHFKNSVSAAVGALIENKLDAISVFARQITVTIHERMMVPFGNFFLMAFLPFMLISRSKNPLFCTAIGQYMLFKKEVYEKIGGHESVKNEILEDIYIAKQVKKHGYKFMIFDGKNNFYCRMYKNLTEVIGGYSKVLAAAFDYNMAIQSITTVLVFLFFLLPFIALPLSFFLFDWPSPVINLLIVQVGLIIIIIIIQAIRFKNRFIDVFLFPVSVVYLLFISVHSLVKSRSSSGIYWKGRTYDVRKEDDLKLVRDNLK